LAVFLSGSGVPSVVEWARLDWVRAVKSSADRSDCSSSSKGVGDIISRGLTVELGSGLVPNREGYISSGPESRDSVGESSNLMLGDAVRVAQESISDPEEDFVNAAN
jgi:hypothetical protein